VLVRPVAVVVDRLRHAIAIGIEELADMGEAVPLRRVLKMKNGRIIANHVRHFWVVIAQAVIEVALPLAQRRPQHWRVAPRIEPIAARIVERQAETKGNPLAYFIDPLLYLLGRQ
jgi:hypothetical protein